MAANGSRIILTSQPEAAVIALSEIQKADPLARPLKRLTPEAQLVSVFSKDKAERMIFVRHRFPVQYEKSLADADVDALALLPPAEYQNLPFSVQFRSDDHNPGYEKALHLLKDMEQALTTRHYFKDDKQPAWALSLFLSGDTLYAGASLCEENLSAYNGGMHRFKKDENFISRAEFKLLEAFVVFGMPKQQKNGGLRALDLGAAPGGWSKALLDKGYSVTAVDPAVLSEVLNGRVGLYHFRGLAQHFFRENRQEGGSFDLLVNDMRMDMMDSCRIMLDMADCLAPDGRAIMTLKLPSGHWYKKTAQALTMLERGYTVLNARQLFHNRAEVTVYLKSKDCNRNA